MIPSFWLLTMNSPLVATFERGVDALAFVYLVLLFPVPFFWFLIHPVIRFWRRFGNRSYWVAVPVWVISGITLVLLRHSLLATRIHRNIGTWAAGIALLGLAVWMESHTRRHFGLRRLAGIPEMNPGHELRGLVQTGLYARMRHPRYVQYMLTLLSMALLTGAEGIFSLAILSILLYQVVAPLEERELLDQYGPPYAAYRESVPRFLPRLWRKTPIQTPS